MPKITISQDQYELLERQAQAYRQMATRLFESLLEGETIKNIVEDFRQTDLYTEGFLNDLESGLKKSSLGRHAWKSNH